MKRWTTSAALVLGLCAAPAAWAADAPPYHDLNSRGGLYLCDREGSTLSSGSIDDRPFAWYAVSRMPAPTGYGNPGGSVTLYAFQPRQDAYPDRWNGDTLTASTAYAEGSPPTTVATGHDFSLRDFLDEYPAQWNGAVQLRMYFGSRANGYDGRDYVSADLQVSGDRWTMLSDPSGTCAAHPKASSIEVTVAHINPTALPTPEPSRAGGGAVAGASGGATGTGAGSHGNGNGSGNGSKDGKGAAAVAADAAAARAAGAASWGTVAGRAAGAIAFAALLSFVVTRLRRRSAART